MKRILITLLVLAVAAAAAPFLLGLRAEAALREGLAQLVRLEPGARAEVVDWQPGWLSSTAETVMTLGSGSPEPRQLRLTHRIAHGPLPYTSTGQARPALAVVETWAQGSPRGARDGVADPASAADLRTVTVIDFDGSRRMHGTLPALALPLQGSTPMDLQLAGVELQVEQASDGSLRFALQAPEVAVDPAAEGGVHLTDAHLAGELAPGLDAFTYELRAAEALLDARNGRHIAFQEVVVEQRAARDASGLWLGDLEASSARAAVGPPGADAPELSALHLATSTVNEAGALTLSVELSAALGVPEDTLGPGLTGATLGLRASGLDAAALGRLQTTSGPRADGTVLDVGTRAALRDLVAASLPRSPQLHVHDLTLRSPQGDLVAELQLRLADGRPELAQYPPLALLLTLEGEAHASAPQAVLVPLLATRWRAKLNEARGLGVLDVTDAELDARALDKATAEVEGWVGQGLLRREADRLTVDVALADGQITVNGAPLALPLGLLRQP